ncbi:hypothetical protein P167DRAFT_609964 [Morchella conica CCBAS932]|uniref:Uncharacterized protein n=1 Tax=Morchella conica CCBAS932 TaxID=1392247 RepID=A0A3N4KBC2_9PEZI|nr:hypothetical protein P167DRAFT_609964 [Morchella conica CCBAS932]
MTFKLLLFVLAACVLAAPVPPLTVVPIPPKIIAPTIVAWTDEPKRRGTLSIISTCCVTLGLCVWTAIHPDILVNGSNKKRLKQKLRMSIKALMMPEDILTAARIQWDHARQLHRALVAVDYIMEENKRKEKESMANDSTAPKHTTEQQSPPRNSIDPEKPQRSPDSEYSEKPPLPEEEKTPPEITPVETALPRTSTHGLLSRAKTKKGGKKEKDTTQNLEEDFENFLTMRVAYFVVMGGFVNKYGKTVTCEEFWRAFVRDPEGVKRKVSFKEIVDKGNASMLAKLIVSFQAIWFLIQLIGRRIARAPMALLELHVAIHIISAAGIYVFWWNKSLDVNEPIVLDVTYVPSYKPEDENDQNDFAPWWMMPTLDTHPDQSSIRRTIRGWIFPPNKGEIGFQNYLRERASAQIKEIRDFNGNAPPQGRTVVERCLHCANGEKSSVHSNLKPTGAGSRYGEIRKAVLEVMPWLGPEGTVGSKFVKLLDLIESKKKKKRSKKEGRKADEEKGADSKGSPKVTEEEKKSEKKDEKNGEKKGEKRVEKVAMTSRARREVNMRSISTCLFYLCYAGLHSTSWNDYFPSDVEKWIWRGSCLVIGIVPALLLLFYVIVIIIQEYDHDPEALRKSQVAMGIILGTVYIVAAGALLVEAFISLRKADSGIYKKVPVSAYLPHL